MTKDSTEQKKKPVRALKPGSSGTSSRRELRRAPCLAKWRSWDWSKPDVELAEEMGFSNSSIGIIRRRIGAPKSPRWHQRRSKFREPYLAKWRNWDWSKQDVELARETGLSRERIRQIRQLLGVPKSPHHRSDSASRRQNTLALQWAAENLDRLRGLSGAEVERKYGFKRHLHVYAFLKAKGVLRNGHLIQKYRWGLMNFELPNGVLQRIWKLPLYRATTYRSRKRLPAPRWNLIGGPAALPRRGELRAYNRAVQAEERKAAKYFAESGRL
jgi:hypothetical protein